MVWIGYPLNLFSYAHRVLRYSSTKGTQTEQNFDPLSVSPSKEFKSLPGMNYCHHLAGTMAARPRSSSALAECGT